MVGAGEKSVRAVPRTLFYFCLMMMRMLRFISKNKNKKTFNMGDTPRTRKRKAESNQPTTLPAFLLNTFAMINEPKFSHIICWSNGGESLLVKDVGSYSLVYLSF